MKFCEPIRFFQLSRKILSGTDSLKNTKTFPLWHTWNAANWNVCHVPNHGGQLGTLSVDGEMDLSKCGKNQTEATDRCGTSV